MCGSERTGFQLRQILSTMDECPEDSPGKNLMQRLLRSYFLWKGGLGKLNNTSSQTPRSETSGQANAGGSNAADTGAVNEALKRKAMAQRGPNAAAKRRRQRGGASGSAGGRFNKATDATGVASFEAEAAQVSKL